MKELIKRIIISRTCKWKKNKLLSKYFDKIVKPLEFRYKFNPSFYIDDDVKIMAFRVIKNGKKISSYVYIEDKKDKSLINISKEFVSKLGVRQLIDPKVTLLNDGIYLTFNTGWSPDGNDIFIMKIYSEQESPKKIIYRGRLKYERNWSFFSKDGELYALYWLNPLKILRLKEKRNHEWEFEDYYSDNKINKNIPEDITIGTQLCLKDNKYYFVAHEKIKMKNKKIYFGRPALFDFENKKIIFGKKMLIHSFLSLLGNKFKTNGNLLSCTYFSGIQIKGNKIILGYGVNDIETRFCQLNIDSFLE
ncbi:hypothetical protein KY334_00020 [Candidatus Woesearchaeota archaeon]|nr:hypothetical protein [Candidatus Woesearchaeota archaeon]